MVTISMPSAASAGRSSRFQSLAWRLVSSVTRAFSAASAWDGREPVDRPNGEPGCLLVHQAGDANHEELVEVGGEDRAELHPLEQRLRLLGGQVEHARVELDPRELAVEEARVGGDGAGRHRLEHYPSLAAAPGDCRSRRTAATAMSVPSASTSWRSKCAISRSDSGSR